MIQILSMFHEKESDKDSWSMTRVVAFLFALTVCTAMLLYARSAKDLNWPFAAVAAMTVLAVPLQGIFTYLKNWVATRPGALLMGKVLNKLAPGIGDTIVSMATTQTELPISPTKPKDP